MVFVVQMGQAACTNSLEFCMEPLLWEVGPSSKHAPMDHFQVWAKIPPGILQ